MSTTTQFEVLRTPMLRAHRDDGLPIDKFCHA